MDSTPHRQYGIYMEGVEWNYKNIWCLDSQNAFDQYGFSYGFHLRPGNTFSGNHAVEMINRIYSSIPRSMKRYFRADSAYSNLSVYNQLLTSNINFVICLKENVWQPLLQKYGAKIKWKKSKLKFFDSDKCTVGSCLYPIKGLTGRSFLRVVFIRAKKKKIKKEDTQYYHYYTVITDMANSEKSDEEILKFYRQRSNAENYIKDLKYGMDFKHFPCRSLMANRVWGLVGIFAYNLMKFSSYILYPNRGCFLKRVRQRMVYLAGELRKGQRKLRIRLIKNVYKEFLWIEERILSCFTSGLIRSHLKKARPPR